MPRCQLYFCVLFGILGCHDHEHELQTKSVYFSHYNDVIMGAMASRITSLTPVWSTVYSGADQRKHQSFASLAFERGIHRWLVNSPHKWPVTRKKVSIWWRHHGDRLKHYGTSTVTTVQAATQLESIIDREDFEIFVWIWNRVLLC